MCLKLSNAEIRNDTVFDYSYLFLTRPVAENSLIKNLSPGIKRQGHSQGHCVIVSRFCLVHLGIMAKFVARDPATENFTFFIPSRNVICCKVESFYNMTKRRAMLKASGVDFTPLL